MSGYEEWWLEYRENCYWSMRGPMLYNLVLSKIFESIFLPTSSSGLHKLIHNSIISLICLAAIISEKWMPRYKNVISVVLSEISIISTYTLGSLNKSYSNDALLVGSVITSLVFQTSQVRNISITMLLQIKFLFLLNIHQLVSTIIHMNISMSTMLSLILGIISIIIYEHNKRNSFYTSFHQHINHNNYTKKLEAIVHSAPESLFVLSSDFKVLLYNPSSNSMLSTSFNTDYKTEIKSWKYSPGRRVYNTECQNDYFYKDLKSYFNSSSTEKVRFGIIWLNQNYINLYGSKIEWDDKQAVIISARDVTSLIHLEISQTELKLKTALLRSVSHELRAPTTAIVTFSDQIEKSEKSISDEGMEKIHMINVCASMLLSLVNDLLDYSQITAGTFKITQREFLLHNLLNDTFTLIKTQSLHKNLDTRLVIDALLPKYAYTDPNRLSQIILNLLTNALKFTFHGYIKMLCEFTLQSKLRVSVIDTGIGIPPCKVNSLFQEFGKLNNSGINPQGVGLGLYISNMLLKSLGGEGIFVESKVNQGSTFWFELDIMQEKFSIELLESSTQSLNAIEREDVKYIPSLDVYGGYNNKLPCILIVDDDYFIIQVLASLLNKAGFSFECARSGKQAFELVKSRERTGFQFKVIVMDCEMPEMDGWTASQKIRELWESGQISSLPNILAHTAHVGEEDRKRCLESGMKDLVLKPTTEAELTSIINRYII